MKPTCRNYRLISVLSFVTFLATIASSQNNTAWDNTAVSGWRNEFRLVDIPSGADGKLQKAFIYSSTSTTPKPLVVSLHTWSGDYTQKDPLADEILARNWNYIHPDFRGKNGNPESTGSHLVISDIEDAIRYAIDNTNTDPEDVHIIGVSGGGYATLLAWMNIRYPVKSFSAWASISDLEAWYWESVGRKQKYSADILKAVSKDSVFNAGEARLRSPLYQAYNSKLRENASLFIYEGVHDGYEGSVPITQSINMYNRLAGELKYGKADMTDIMLRADTDTDLVSEKEIINLVTRRLNPVHKDAGTLFGREIYLHRQYKNISITIFNGGHEQLPQALGLIPWEKTKAAKYNILTIGDSNGQIRGGWTDQLKKMLPGSTIINNSQSGRTIGFDNGGRKELNALSNIDSWLGKAMNESGKSKFDFLVLCLGTNDTKLEFAGRQEEVVANFGKLLLRIKDNPLYRKTKPVLIYVTPPPLRATNVLEKYKGCSERIAALVPLFKSIALKNGFRVVDIHTPLLGIEDYYASDGVHMSAEGQEIVASAIVEVLQKGK
ncbi:MAG: GDSL-type esterase/lipase family protein [Bacteroidales bacterium]